jgi:carbon-monoxide dehydrogenase medium subunit
MIPAAFDFKRAGSVDEAISLLGSSDGAKLLAGGHSLLPLMKLRLARPSTLIDIGRLSDLSYIREDGDAVAIGALTRHHDVANSDALHELCPIVSYTAGEIGDPQVRHVGTIGGSVAHADPASDMPTVLVALDASLVIQGPSGSRTVGSRDFFKGLFTSDLAEDEVLTEVRVPKTAGRGWSYIKFHRRAQDWALVGVAAVAGNGAGGASVALTNMGETPLRASAVEAALAGGADPASAAQSAAEGTTPPSDSFGSADYRRELVKVLVRRALEDTMS